MTTYVEDDDAVPSWDDIRLTRLARLQGDTRSARELREHYALERQLADRLRRAPRSQRPGLYSKVYDELFRRLPHHPQLQAAGTPRDGRHIDRLLGLLRGYFTPDTVFM